MLRIVLGTLLVLAGLASALVTVMARRADQSGLAGAAAILSLIIALLLTIFIVPPLARSARVEVANLDFPVEPTSGGGVFLVIIVVVGFAAWNTGNNLLFLVFSLLCSTLFVGWMAARTSLRDLTVSARFPDHIFAAEAAPVIVTLRNNKRALPSFSVLVEARGPTNDAEVNSKRRRRHLKRVLAYFSYVPHRSAAEQRVEQLFPTRGHVLIDGFELSTRFPFGFFRRRRRLRARNVDIIVYPKPEVISDELHLLPMYAGRMPALRRGAGHDLFSMRDYQPQDDLRHIDWKATARSRRLTVREFTSEDEKRITIVLDTRLPRIGGGDLSERFEHGVVQAASLINHFIDERAEVRLVIGEEVGPFGSGTEQLYRCLRRLALVTPVDNDGAETELAHASRDVVQHDYAILLTAAAPGSIPANVWRTSHVIYL
ncbi:MAG TPA: DUF58 domain-containing protein [Pyrinomonadaceae bacterium]|jgi:uncharacterized protein (DUF58 family)|nr:DUF58 domain-containing protein [Pyrinomonadaceae bacterium]